MAFRAFLSSLGINAPDVETVLDTTVVRPGDRLGATVTVRGGGADVRVERLVVDLVTRVEAFETNAAWNRPGVVVSRTVGAFDLAAGETVEHRVEFDIPWEMPLTHALGLPLKGARTAVRTSLEIDNAVDRGDFDEISVHALPAQDVFFTAYHALGFRFDEAEVKKYRCTGGDNQTLAYCQELEFFFPTGYGWQPGAQLETLFIARPDSLDLITGSLGPYAFAYAELDVDTAKGWLDEHLRSHFQR